MPCDIIWEPGGVVIRYHGLVTADEFLRSVLGPQGDPRFDSLRYILGDFLAAEGHDITSVDVVRVGAYLKGAARSNPHLWIGVVTCDRELADLFRIIASPPFGMFPLRIFADQPAARAWVGAEAVL